MMLDEFTVGVIFGALMAYGSVVAWAFIFRRYL